VSSTLIDTIQEADSGSARLDCAMHQTLKLTSKFVAPYTTSLDAIVALIGEKLPGWTIANVGQKDDKSWWAELRRGHTTSFDAVALSSFREGARPRTAALALCQALLTALQSQGEKA